MLERQQYYADGELFSFSAFYYVQLNRHVPSLLRQNLVWKAFDIRSTPGTELYSAPAQHTWYKLMRHLLLGRLAR